MDVMTISRQLGSWGQEIGQIISKRKGYRLVWREIINLAAIQSGVPEVALAMIDELGLLGISPSQDQQQVYLASIGKIMNDIADNGRVILIGRAGQLILRGNPRVFHVRIIAPVEVRASRVAERNQIPFQAAKAQVEASDRSRKNFIFRSFHVDWEDPLLYHLVINTENIEPERAADLVCPILD